MGKAQGIEEPTMKIVEKEYSVHLKEFLSTQPFFEGADMDDVFEETFDGFGSDEHLAAQTARMKAELRKGIARRLKAQGIEEPTMKIVEEMAGEQDGTSAEMLQLIRENLEEALTGEYAEEL